MNRDFWKAAFNRAVRTAAQAAMAFIGANAVTLSDVNLLGTLSAAGLGFVLSMLMSIATGLPEAPYDGGGDDVNG